MVATHDAASSSAPTTSSSCRRRRGTLRTRTASRPLAAHGGPLALLASALLAIPAGILPAALATSLAVLATQLVLACVGTVGARAGTRPSRAGCGGSSCGCARAGGCALGRLVDLVARRARPRRPPSPLALRVLIIVLPSAVLIPLDRPRRGSATTSPSACGAGPPGRRPRPPCSGCTRSARSGGDLRLPGGCAAWASALAARWRSCADLAALTLGLLVRTLRMAADLAVAMDARGFASASRRTWFAPAPWRTGRHPRRRGVARPHRGSPPPHSLTRTHLTQFPRYARPVGVSVLLGGIG